jgi:hypothetical protein
LSSFNAIEETKSDSKVTYLARHSKEARQIEKLISIPPRGRLTLQCLVSLVESNLSSSQHYVLFKPPEELTLFIEPLRDEKNVRQPQFRKNFE